MKPDWKDAFKMGAEIEFTEDGFYETQNYLGELTRSYVDVRARQFEKAVRDKLIEFGWTLPPEPTP